MSFASTKQKTLSLLPYYCGLRKLKPDANDLEGASRELKYYWAHFNKLTLQDGILGIQKSIDDGPNQIFCAIVPQASKQEILEQAHGSPSGGHFGVQKTRETTSAFSLGANVQRRRRLVLEMFNLQPSQNFKN